MSYPSIHRHLEARGVTLGDASDDQLRQAFLDAFEEDLPLGFARVTELVRKLDGQEQRAMVTLDPNSKEGQQYTRLLAPDIPRQVLEDHFGCAFGFYNCCKGVAARSRDGLRLSLREQIEAQHPQFVDC